MTVEQFWQLPEDEAFHYELHHGELVKVSRPKWKHIRTSRASSRTLKLAFGSLGIVLTELSFRPLPEHEVWAADVAFVSRARAARVEEDDVLHGAPDIVIEVLSRSNTVSRDRRKVRGLPGKRLSRILDRRFQPPRDQSLHARWSHAHLQIRRFDSARAGGKPNARSGRGLRNRVILLHRCV